MSMHTVGSHFAQGRSVVLTIAPLLAALAFMVLSGTSPAYAQTDYVEQNREQINQACILTGTCNSSNPGAKPAPPPLPDVWGALAVSPSTLLWGSSWKWNSKKEAESEALRRCHLEGGPGDCKIVVTVADVCASLAVSPAQRVFSVGGPAGAANFSDNNAVLQCQRAGGKACSVVASFCADGIRHVLNGHTINSNGNPIFVPNNQTGTALRK
jgi:hypothetical protein